MTLTVDRVRHDPKLSMACCACTMGGKDCELIAEVLGFKGQCIASKDGALEALLKSSAKRGRA